MMIEERILWVSPKRFRMIQDLSRKCSISRIFDETQWITGLKEILGYQRVSKMLASPFAPFTVHVKWNYLEDDFEVRQSDKMDFEEEQRFVEDRNK